MVLSIIFLEEKHEILLHLSIFYEYQQFFQHRICFSIQPPDYSDPWPRLIRSSIFFLIMLFNHFITSLFGTYQFVKLNIEPSKFAKLNIEPSKYYFHKLSYFFPIQNTCTVKPVSKGHSRESENVPFMDSCPLDIG